MSKFNIEMMRILRLSDGFVNVGTFTYNNWDREARNNK